MKKKILVLGLIASIFCMMFGMTVSAGASMADDPNAAMISAYEDNLAEVIPQIVELVNSGMAEMYADDPAIKAFDSALKDMGEFVGAEEIHGTMEGDVVTIKGKLLGSKKNATVTWTIDMANSTSDVKVDVEKSFGELMTNAGLNTLLGMGTVFAVLILISIVITCFEFIPKIQAAFTKKEAAAPAAAVEQAVAQIEAQEEELADDLELVAVISAAIAAAEGTSTDGFVVRSIRRATAVRGARF